MAVLSRRGKRLLARFPRVIASLGRHQEELVRHGARPERVVVILNGIDPAAFKRDPGVASRPPPTRLLAGRYRDWRGRPARTAEAVRPADRGVRRAAGGTSPTCGWRLSATAACARDLMALAVTFGCRPVVPLARPSRGHRPVAPCVRSVRAVVGVRRHAECGPRGDGPGDAAGRDRCRRDARAGASRCPRVDRSRAGRSGACARPSNPRWQS